MHVACKSSRCRLLSLQLLVSLQLVYLDSRWGDPKCKRQNLKNELTNDTQRCQSVVVRCKSRYNGDEEEQYRISVISNTYIKKKAKRFSYPRTSTHSKHFRRTRSSPLRSSSTAAFLSSGSTTRAGASFCPSSQTASSGAATACCPLLDTWLKQGPSLSFSMLERAPRRTSQTSASFCEQTVTRILIRIPRPLIGITATFPFVLQTLDSPWQSIGGEIDSTIHPAETQSHNFDLQQ